MLVKDILFNNINEIQDLLNEGISFKKIGKKFNCDHSTIYDFVRLHKLFYFNRNNESYKVNKYKFDILKLWNSGYSCYKIAKTLNIHKSFVIRLLKRDGINISINSSKAKADLKYGKNRVRVNDVSNEICKLYSSGLSPSKICKTLNLSNRSDIRSILIKNNIIIPAKTHYFFNLDYFQNINSAERAYLMGLWYADGNVYKDRMRLLLQEQDKSLIEKIVEKIEFTGPIKKRITKHKDQYGFSLCRRGLCDLMSKLGAPPNKCWKIRFPGTDILPTHLHWAFVAGFLMGDGHCVIEKKYRNIYLGFTSNKNFLQGLQDILPITSKVKIDRKKSSTGQIDPNFITHTLNIRKKIDVLSVGNWLYSDQNMKDCEYLNFDRKCLKFRQYLINKGT